MLRRRLFKTNSVQAGTLYEIPILIFVVVIVASVILGQCRAREERAEAEKRLAEVEKLDLFYTHLVRLAQGRIKPENAPSLYGEKFTVIEEGDRTIIPWPDPLNLFETNPRFVRRSGGLTFDQDFPPVRFQARQRLPLAEDLTVSEEGQTTIVRRRNSAWGIEFPHGTRRVVIRSGEEHLPEVLEPVLALVPVRSAMNLDLLAIYLANGVVRNKTLFHFDGASLPAVALIHQALFKPEESR